MAKKKLEPEVVLEDLKDNEEFISRDDIDIEVMTTADDEPTVYVKFTNFEDAEDAEEYAEFLAETLPLLLFETTRLQ
jgi:hypothetical protein